MEDVKQVIVVRKDLNMRKGKIASQCCHASMKVWFDRMDMLQDEEGFYYQTNILNEDFIKWKEGLFTKVVVGVESDKPFEHFANQAKKLGIPYAIIEDAGLTEFHGEKTVTCMALGPARSSKINKITGDLKLL